PFINEDYAFLDVTRGRSLFSLWHVTAASSDPWVRPWSQGFHYWLLQSLLGLHVGARHVVSLLLGLSIVVSYYLLVRRAAGRQQAGLATACSATLVAWGLPLT